nr:uncharacterized protein LOC103413658 isoform X4 [Malus domestica]
MAEASSASATKSDEEKVEMMDRLLTRLALCDDSNLQPPTLTLQASPLQHFLPFFSIIRRTQQDSKDFRLGIDSIILPLKTPLPLPLLPAVAPLGGL